MARALSRKVENRKKVQIPPSSCRTAVLMLWIRRCVLLHHCCTSVVLTLQLLLLPLLVTTAFACKSQKSAFCGHYLDWPVPVLRVLFPSDGRLLTAAVPQFISRLLPVSASSAAAAAAFACCCCWCCSHSVTCMFLKCAVIVEMIYNVRGYSSY